MQACLELLTGAALETEVLDLLRLEPSELSSIGARGIPLQWPLSDGLDDTLDGVVSKERTDRLDVTDLCGVSVRLFGVHLKLRLRLLEPPETQRGVRGVVSSVVSVDMLSFL